MSGFGLVELEITLSHLSGGVKPAIGLMSL